MKLTSSALLVTMTLLPVTVIAGTADSPRWQRHMTPLTMPKVAKVAKVEATPESKALPSAPAPITETTMHAPTRFIGSLMQNGELFIFVEYNGQVYSLREGEELPGTFEVVSATDKEAHIVYASGHESRIIRLD